MSEAVETTPVVKAPLKKRKPRVRPARAVNFAVYTVNGEPLSEASVKKVEEALQTAVFELFNEGVRVLTQTTRAAA